MLSRSQSNAEEDDYENRGSSGEELPVRRNHYKRPPTHSRKKPTRLSLEDALDSEREYSDYGDKEYAD